MTEGPLGRQSVRATTRVRVAQGVLDGVTEGGVQTFLGVPYAAAPVGDRRFLPPEPAPAWPGSREATRPPAPAMQPRLIAGVPPASEDCLYLNIWAPEAPGSYPVLVYLHGGGNYFGYSLSDDQPGVSFARDSVVCVTVGYRLGAFGFLELGSILGPRYRGSANNGLRDVLAALTWVHDNITAFGGDPSRVTLGGISSGAFNVCSLLSSPLSTGLFQQAIAQSGGGHAVFDLAEADAAAAQFVAGLAAEDLGPADLLRVDAARLIAVHDGNVGHGVIDGEVLTGIPAAEVAWGAGREVTLLIGSTRDEMASLGGSGEIGEYEEDVAALYERVAPHLDASSREQAVLEFVSALRHGASSFVVGHAHAAAGGTSFVYRWEHEADSGPYAGLAAHGSEQPYVWSSSASEEGGASPRSLARRVHRRWTDFVTQGSPGDDWPRWLPEDRGYLSIAQDDGVRNYPGGLLDVWLSTPDALRPKVRFSGAWLPPRKPAATRAR